MKIILFIITFFLIVLAYAWKVEAAFVAPTNITAGCKGKEKSYDYKTLRTSLLADVVNNKPISPCMFKALIKIIDTEQKVQPMTTRNFNRKQIIKSVSTEIQLRNK